MEDTKVVLQASLHECSRACLFSVNLYLKMSFSPSKNIICVFIWILESPAYERYEVTDQKTLPAAAQQSQSDVKASFICMSSQFMKNSAVGRSHLLD